MFGTGRYYAQLIHDGMNPTNRDFINLLLARSEVNIVFSSVVGVGLVAWLLALPLQSRL